MDWHVAILVVHCQLDEIVFVFVLCVCEAVLFFYSFSLGGHAVKRNQTRIALAGEQNKRARPPGGSVSPLVPARNRTIAFMARL